MVALPLAMGRLVKHVGASPWAVPFVAPVAMGWLFHRGFVTNLMGLAALLAALPTLDLLPRAPTVKRLVAALGFVVLLYATHALMLIAAAGALVLFVAGTPHPHRRGLAYAAAAFAVAAGLLGLDHVWAGRLSSARVAHVPVSMDSLGHKIVTLPGFLFGGTGDDLVYALAALVALGIALFAAASARGRPSREPSSEPVATSLVAFLEQRRFELFGASCLGLYAILPFTWHGAGLVYPRFLAPAFLVLVACAARVPSHGPSVIVRVVAAALPVATVFLALPGFAEAGARVDSLDAIVPDIAIGSAVLELDLGAAPRSVQDVAQTVPVGRVLAARGGRMLDSFAESPISPARIDLAYDWPEPIERIKRPVPLRPSAQSTRFRYVLLQTPDPAFARLFQVATSTECTLVSSAGEWFLFESTLPVVPLTSPDVPNPTRGASWLRARLSAASPRRGRGLAGRRSSPVGRAPTLGREGDGAG